MLSLMGNVFVEHRKRGFLPWSNSLRQLVVEYVKAFRHDKDGDLDCKVARGVIVP